ncbi:MAG: hypothetical protein JWR21_858 [Herminiimonas sp.]|nr:hypothetical protein [Herminiimonas sp.]
MFRIDDPSAAPALPAPEAAGTEGYFTEGNPGVTAASLVRASFLNMIQEELRAVVVAGGLTPSKTTYNQLLLALQALYAPLTAFAASRVAAGYQKLPGGLIIQWGSQTIGNATAIGFPIPFPNACLQVVICDGASTAYSCAAGTLTASGCTGWAKDNSGAYNTATARFIAFGW